MVDLSVAAAAGKKIPFVAAPILPVRLEPGVAATSKLKTLPGIRISAGEMSRALATPGLALIRVSVGKPIRIAQVVDVDNRNPAKPHEQ